MLTRIIKLLESYFLKNINFTTEPFYEGTNSATPKYQIVQFINGTWLPVGKYRPDDDHFQLPVRPNRKHLRSIPIADRTNITLIMNATDTVTPMHFWHQLQADQEHCLQSQCTHIRVPVGWRIGWCMTRIHLNTPTQISQCCNRCQVTYMCDVCHPVANKTCPMDTHQNWTIVTAGEYQTSFTWNVPLYTSVGVSTAPDMQQLTSPKLQRWRPCSYAQVRSRRYT